MNDHVIDELIVVKRSGQRVNFNGLKIALAIKNAFDSVDDSYDENEVNKVYEDTLKYIVDNYKDRKTINVEDIQDIIENILKQDKYLVIYKSFSEYRIRRSESRKAFSVKQQHKFVKAIEKIGTTGKNTMNELLPREVLTNFGNIVSDEFTKSYIIDSKTMRMFDEGKIYIHNFSYFNLGYVMNTHLMIKNLKLNNCFSYLTELLIKSTGEINGEVSICEFDKLLSNVLLEKFKNSFKYNLKKYFELMDYIEYLNIRKIYELIDKSENITIDFKTFDPYILGDIPKKVIKKAYDDSYNETMNYFNSNMEIFLKSVNDYDKIKFSFSLSNSSDEITKLLRNIILNIINRLEYLKNIALIYKINKDDYNDLMLDLILNNKNIYIVFNNKEYFSDGYLIHENNYNESSSGGRMMVSNISLNMCRLFLIHKSVNSEFYNDLDDLLKDSLTELQFIFEKIGDKYKNNYRVLFNNTILDDEKFEGNQKIRKVLKNGTLNLNIIGLDDGIKNISKVNSKDKIISNILRHIYNYVNEKSKENRFNYTISVIKDNDASNYLMNLDKAFFGIKSIKNEEFFCFNENEMDNRLSSINNYQKYLTGGLILNLSLSRKIGKSKLIEILNSFSKYNSGIVHVRCKR